MTKGRDSTSMRWIWFSCGVVFLLISSFMDNARGPLYPALSELLHFDYSTTGNLLVAGNLIAFAFNLTLMFLTNQWSLRRLSLAVGLLASVFCLSSYFVDSIPRLYLWGAFLGGTVSVMGTVSNLFTQRSAPAHLRHRAMSGVHAAYGFASFFAPLIAAKVVSIPQHWPRLYLFALLPIALLMFVSFKVAPKESPKSGATTKQAVRLDFEHWLVIAVMVFYVAGEVISSMWMTTWAVANGHTLQEGAAYTAMFFVLMTVTRLLCSFFVTARWMWVVMWSSLIVSALSFALGRVLNLPWLVAGMGCLGPFFPLYVSYVTVRYPDRDRTMVIWILSLMQGLLAIMNLSVGQLAVRFGIDVAYWLAPVMIVLALALLVLVRRQKQVGASPTPS